MAKTEKTYFGEEKTAKATVKAATAAKKTRAPRKAKAKTAATTAPRGWVTIHVPAALAFQIGMQLGQEIANA